jgi:hypothetical protein
MTAADAPVISRPAPAGHRPGLATGRLLWLELRHNAMLWMIPVAVALFWLITYRKSMAQPPLWNARAVTMQSGAVVDFAIPVVAAAAWMGSRDGRRHITDLVAISARPRWARQLATWAATTCWAMVAYLVCVAMVYGVTARQAAWGGPLWWPAAVGAASLPAFSALGFAAGWFFPGRFTTPVAAIAAFFVLALATQPIHGSQSYWQVSPLVAYAWDIGPDPGVATFYHYVPDLSLAQVMFVAGLTLAALGALGLPARSGSRWLRRSAAAITAAGLLAAGTGVALAGTGRLDAHGMITIPALHDAASDRPIRYTPVCHHDLVPVCLNPAYTAYLPAVAAALEPVLRQVAGLPGAPVRVSQAAASYHQGAGNNVSITMAGPALSGRPPVFHLLLPDQLQGPALTVSELAAWVRSISGPEIVASVVGGGPGARASQAQQAVAVALGAAAGDRLGGGSEGPSPRHIRASAPCGPCVVPGAAEAPGPGTPVFDAARRFAAWPAAARRAWLVTHWAALRAGRITLAQLP